MTTTEVENLTAIELKARRAELIEAVKSEPDLAARYVQARTDAKVRDEKLAEQGETIKVLQAGMASLTGLDKKILELKGLLEASYQRNDTLRANLTEKTTHANAAESLAKARRAALADVMQFAMSLSAKVAPLLATE